MPTHPALQPLLTALVLAGGAATPTLLRAKDAEPSALHEVTITRTREDLQGSASSASEGIVTAKQLRTRPVLRTGDLMETVPGLMATQHAGEGKANQYFMRGFNLDHGTDLATLVDGVPVNLPTHGHGQGYTDLYFLIPELVESVQYRKGPYAAEDGDFAAAGSVRFRTLRRLDRPFGLVEAGGHGYRRLVTAGSVETAGGDLMLAAEQSHDDGPWRVPQDARKLNLVGKYTQGTAANGFSIGVTHYEGRWTSTDQIPQRAIDSGLIGRFDSLDPSSGGHTQRTGLNASWSRQEGDGRMQVNLYALRYHFNLFSNFTYATRGCSSDPLAAVCNRSSSLDQFEQVDRRSVYGVNSVYSAPLKLQAIDGQWSVGVDLRQDRIGEVGLYDTMARQRLDTVRSDQVRIGALGLWGQAELQWSPQWRSILGWRWDQRQLDVASSIAANSGKTTASMASPKASLIYSPSSTLDLYANAGRGFHSNDARGALIRVDPRNPSVAVDPATPLVRATGAEVGTRQKWSPRLTTTMALWQLQLDSELLFVGDAGTTEPSRPSKRQGLEFTANWRPDRAWEIDADLALTRPRFANASLIGNRIPGAMERIAALGVTYQSGPWTFGARVRHFGSRALLEDNSLRASGSTLTNVKAAYRMGPNAELSLDVFNLLNQQASDVAYAYASRLPGEAAFAEGNTPATLHLHPSLPRTLRVGLRLMF